MKLSLDVFRSLFRPQQEIYDESSEGRQFNAVYLLMLVLACLIALLGLLLNSPVVIIGAMLISPLMGPILSCALALNLADWSLGKKAARNVVLSVAETILIAMAATALAPLKDPTPEILARTHPNLMDLLVAFFSGTAGTLAFCSRSEGALMILPGVAIATAVMPPPATTGYGISTPSGMWPAGLSCSSSRTSPRSSSAPTSSSSLRGSDPAVACDRRPTRRCSDSGCSWRVRSSRCYPFR